AQIGRRPATGSPRYAHELNLPDLRSWPLTRHHYLVFYVERSDHADVGRVLRRQRDIPAWMQDPEAI
ncbi:MAG: type II toxin-antitoxin system RelE/ParE family toxin, partial [Betaproteobacteria bacterium]